jgi:hypothetical protein
MENVKKFYLEKQMKNAHIYILVSASARFSVVGMK